MEDIRAEFILRLVYPSVSKLPVVKEQIFKS